MCKLRVLTGSFGDNEIFSALKNYVNDKTSAPNRFNFHFYKCAWNLLKRDVISFLFNLASA